MPDAAFDMQACIARVKQRDETAARELLQQLYPLVLKLVRGHLPRRTSEEDLCQMIFIKIFQNLEQYAGNVPVEHWVSRIAINTCLNQLQSEKVRPELRWADLSEEEAAALQKASENRSEISLSESIASKEVTQKLLEQLNPQDRVVINLMHIEGCSLQEIAKITGWNTTLVKVRAFRARQRLKQAFNHLMSEGKL